MNKNKNQRLYETMVIWDPNLGNTELDSEISRLKEIIEKGGGTCLDIDNWGKRRLAFEIKKRNEGFYVVVTFNGNPNILKDVFEHFKFDDNVVRHMSIQKGDAQEKKPEEVEEEEESTVSEEELE